MQTFAGHTRTNLYASLAEATDGTEQQPDADDEKHEIHGVILGPDETTNGKHGKKFWDSAEQEKAAKSLIGKPFSLFHEGEAVDVGEITEAGFKDDVGTFYSAEMDMPEVAAALSTGTVDTSVEASVPDHSHIGYTDEDVPYMMDYEFNRISALPPHKSGASKANYSAPGNVSANPALQAALAEAEATITLDIGEMPIDTDTLVSLADEYDIAAEAFAEAAARLTPDNVQVTLVEQPDPNVIKIN